jgi:hypothetical protein
LVLTTAIDKVDTLVKNEKNIIVRKVSFDEVNSYLNAADMGIILREDVDLNRSASPTKFAEYALSGLSICYSEFVGDLNRYTEDAKAQNLFLSQDYSNIHDISSRVKRANNYKKILSKDVVLSAYKKVYNFTQK